MVITIIVATAALGGIYAGYRYLKPKVVAVVTSVETKVETVKEEVATVVEDIEKKV